MAESADAGLHRCPTCGGLARVVGDAEGTRYYRPVTAEIAALREGLDWALREGGWRLIEQASTPPPPIIARGPIGEPGRRRSGDDDHDG